MIRPKRSRNETPIVMRPGRGEKPVLATEVQMELLSGKLKNAANLARKEFIHKLNITYNNAQSNTMLTTNKLNETTGQIFKIPFWFERKPYVLITRIVKPGNIKHTTGKGYSDSAS